MSSIPWSTRQIMKARLVLPGIVVIAAGLAGCASMTEDVDAYYRQMAYNYREAGEKAKMDEMSLDSQAKVLAGTGQFKQQKRVERELERVKSWEAKCDKQAERFQKAAEWTEGHFHLTRPEIPDGPTGAGKSADGAVLQASGAQSP